jgi:8-oxo-dGTP diphosphatase
MDMIKVVCGIIYKDGKILICRRKPNKSLGGYWEFPGGKVVNGESNEVSLKRELMEELQMEVDGIQYFFSAKHDYESFSIDLIAYTCNLKSWNLLLTDHDKYDWVTPGEILNWKLAPADVSLAQTFKKKNLTSKRRSTLKKKRNIVIPLTE